LTLSNDQGSDCAAGVYALCYHEPLKLNVTAFWDQAHGSWRDIQRMVKLCGHYPFLLLSLVTMNLNHGPDSTDLRYHQLRQAMQHHLRVASPASSPLFQALAARMLAEAAGELSVDSTQDPLARLWEHLRGQAFAEA
jgi:hypothetical protein